MRVEGPRADLTTSLTCRPRRRGRCPGVRPRRRRAGSRKPTRRPSPAPNWWSCETPTRAEPCRPPLAPRRPAPVQVPRTRASTATFEELRLADVHAALRQSLLSQVPESLRVSVAELLGSPAAGGPAGADPQAAVRTRLTLRRTTTIPRWRARRRSAGLIPTSGSSPIRHWSAAKPSATVGVVDALSNSVATSPAAVLALGLPRSSAEHQTFMRRLVAFAGGTSFAEPRQWCRSIAVEPGSWPPAFQHWPEENDHGDQPIAVTWMN